MVTRPMEDQGRREEPRNEERIQILDRDLAIMDEHAGEMVAVEGKVQEEMRRWDREHKDECLHSTPRPRKHLR